MGVIGLQQVPLVAVEVEENRYEAVRLSARLLGKPDSARLHIVIVVPKVAGVEKQKDTPSGLISNVGQLLWRRCLGQEQGVLSPPSSHSSLGKILKGTVSGGARDH